MTYKELLFKMADKGMLTLSADKDGRGLFWAGMDNMEALEKPFDLGDFDSHEDIYGESDNYEEVPTKSTFLGLDSNSNLSPLPYKDKQGRIVAPFNSIR
jgi:hypothetical protein